MTSIVAIPVDRIDPHPLNPRHDLGDLTELVRSIKAQGIRQNLLVVRNGERVVDDEVSGGIRHQGRYTAVIGHRRLAAAKLAGLTTVPCVVDDLGESEQLELMLVENVQRTDLSPIEEAEGYQGLLDFGYSDAAVAKRVGRTAKTIRSRVQLLGLPEAARAKVHAGQASLLDAAKLEAFADDPAALEKLIAKLGTSDFGYAVQSEKDARKHREALQAVIDALIARGAVEGDRQARYIGWVDSVARVEELTIPEGATFVISYNYAQVYGPQVADDEAAATRAEQEAEWEAKRERHLAHQAAQAAAWTLRDQFVREFARRAKVTAKERDAIVAAAAPYLMARANEVSSYDVAVWCQMKDSDRYDWAKTKKVVTRWAADLDPAAVLLVLLHITVGRDVLPEDQPLFDALEFIGYVVSDVERGWLTEGDAGD